MIRREFLKLLGVAVAMIAAPLAIAQTISVRTGRKIKKKLGGTKYWMGRPTEDWSDPANWAPYGIPKHNDTVVMMGGRLKIPEGTQLRRLDIHDGIVRSSPESCGKHCCFGELVVHPGNAQVGTVIGEGCGTVIIDSS